MTTVNFGDPRLPDRFWDKVQPCPMSGCWIWVGSTSRGGYGNFQSGSRTLGTRRMVAAHRFAYESLCGPISDVLDHLCRLRCCVNPAHLEDVDERTNILRGVAPSILQSREPACRMGHPFTPENTRIRGRHRRCRMCDRLAGRAKRARHRRDPQRTELTATGPDRPLESER